jgi:DNA polymerase III subunit delta'
MTLGIVGQDQVVGLFRRTLRRGRLASTYLFVGPGGIGKRTFAHRLAQALFCERMDPAELAPCEECDACRLCLAGNHPDLLEVARRPDRSQLVLEQFVGPKENRHREGLCHDLSLKPMLGTRRIAIIDDADTFSSEVANALLKTLEEPPPRSLLILVGTSLAKQLPTIRSRAQVMPFAPLADEVVAKWLLEWELVETESDAERIAAAAGGSLDRAKTMLIPELWRVQGEVVGSLGRPIPDSAAMADAIQRFVQETSKEAGPKREAALAVLGLVVDHFRGLLGGEPDSPQAEAWMASVERSMEAEYQIGRHVNLPNVLQSWADDLVRLGRHGD